MTASATAAAPPAEAPPTAAERRLALLGNPNTGKTTLFNRLCGLRAKTANFPGTTTDARLGRCRLDGFDAPVEVIDLPGTYSLHLELPEARISGDVLRGAGLYRRPDAVLVVIDATNLQRNLRLVGELLGFGLPTVVALNMVDLAQRRGLSLDPQRLAAAIGCPVVPIVARQGRGLDDLRTLVGRVLHGELENTLRPRVPESDGLAAWAAAAVAASVGGDDAVGTESDTVTERLDQAFTHPLLGVAVFVAVMAGLFWTVFAFATVPMDLIELTFEHLGGWLGALLPAGDIRDLLVDGVVAGVAGTVVFLPQICILFFLISLLEDTGYLARAAFVMDRVLCRFGLPGHAFVPLLSSHACALPGIVSTRLIPDPRDRLATILVAPFMSCSARLPVYVLLIGLLFRDRPLLGGLAFAGCYLLGAGVALASAWLFRRTLLRGRSRPMMLELPSYKLPSLRTALFTAIHQGKTFLEKAGTVIVAICIVMWWLSAYPQSEAPAAAEALRAEAQAVAASDPEAAAVLEADADLLAARHTQAQSFAGRIGRTIEPVFAPLGYDWQLTVGVLTSFLAREVFVSTMAVLLESDPDDSEGVVDRVRSATRDDGSPLLTPATAASLLVFFVLAMQCLPTLALTRREAGGLRWAVLQLVYMSGLAWIAAFVTFHGLHAVGIS
ncbi:MAG: ferrous iron transporter B [Acidobacteriota bacterium]